MSRRTAVNVLLSIAGIALLAWQVNNAGGLETVWDGLTRVGIGFVVILTLQLVRFGLRSYAWVALLGRPAPFSAALAATISGDALGNLTPLGLAASEPAKAVYLGRHVDPTQALAALTAENFFYSVSVAVYVIVGAAAMLVAFDLPPALEQAGIAALLLMAVILVAAGWIAWQRPAAASRLLSWIPSPRLGALIDRVRDFEVRTYGSPGHEGARLGMVALAECAFQAASFAESWFTLYVLTDASLPLQALILDSVNRIINIVFKMIPLRTGVDEFTAGTVALAIGLLRGVGVQAALVRKVRMIVFGGGGTGDMAQTVDGHWN